MCIHATQAVVYSILGRIYSYQDRDYVQNRENFYKISENVCVLRVITA